MEYLVLEDGKGGSVKLTTESSASSDGIPVLRVESEESHGDYGPSDLIGDLEGNDFVKAAEIVAAWGKKRGRTQEEKEAARLFLHQWPQGPQV